MFRRGKRKDPSPQGKSANIAITIGSQSLEADAIIDVTAQYPWKARPVKEVRLGKRADVFRDIVSNRPQIDIGDEIYSYVGGSGFDSRGYFVLVEKVGQKASPPPEPTRATPEAPRTPTVADPEPRNEQAQPQTSPAAEATSNPLISPSTPEPKTNLEAAEPGRYSQLTREEYEAMPMSEAAKVPPDIVERLHGWDKTPASAEAQPQASGDLDEDLRQLLAGMQLPEAATAPHEYSELTLEEYEAMPMSEAAKVPPEVVDRLRRSSNNFGGGEP